MTDRWEATAFGRGGLSLLREVVRIEDLWEGPCAGRGTGMTNF